MVAKTSSHWPLTLTNGAAALFGICLPLVFVRILSPEQVGRYNIFFLYVMVFPNLFFTGGLTNGLYHWAGKYPEAKSEVQQSWTLLMGISLVAGVMGLFLVEKLAPVMKMPAIDLQMILVFVPFILAANFFEDLLIARGEIWRGSVYSSGFNVVRITSLLVSAWWTRNVMAVFWTFLAGTVLRALAGWLLLLKWGEIKFIFSLAKTKSVLQYAMPVSIASVASLALHHVDQMVLSVRLSPAKFAFYAVGCLSVPPLQILEASVNRVMIPRLSHAFAANENAEASALFSEGVLELFRILLPATLGMIIYAEPIIRILFTERYMESVPFLQWFAVVYLIWSIPFDAVARARGDGKWILKTMLLFSALSISATWWAAGQWSTMGALIAVIVGQLVMRLYSLGYDRRWFRVSLATFLPLKEIGIQTAWALSAGVVSLLLRPLFSDSRLWFVVTGPLFTILYFGATYAVSLQQHMTSTGPLPVLELVQTLNLGGLERVVTALAQALNRNDHFRVLVATYDHPDGQPSLGSQLTEAGIPLIQWQKGKGFSIRTVVQLVQYLFSERIRVLHVHDLGPLIYGSLAKWCSLGRIRLVLTLHTLLDIERNPRYRFYYKVFLHFPDRIIAVSHGVKAGLLALGVSPKRIDVIANGVSFSPPLNLRGESGKKLSLRKKIQPGLPADLYEARWILCLARLHPGKGQDIVLEVWSALPAPVRGESVLFLVGQEAKDGYAQTLREKMAGVPDRQRVFLAGPTEHPWDWIQSSDMFISGSLLEGMPLAPLEAAGLGLPTLLSNIEGHQFLKPWALYFDPEHPATGAKKIVEIFDELNRDGDINVFENRWNAAASLRQTWDASAMTAAYTGAFESILHGGLTNA